MAESSIVFNDEIETYINKFHAKRIPLSVNENPSIDFQKRKLLALIFEQFLLFDKIAFKVDLESNYLHFLFEIFGINKLEELLDHNIIKLVLWTPMIVIKSGRMKSDGSMDDTIILGEPPLFSMNLSYENADPEKRLEVFFNKYPFHKDRKKSFIKRTLKQFVIPENSIAENSAKIVIEAFQNNRFSNLGLKADKEPEFLNGEERRKLSVLGNQVITTTVLANSGFKSYNNHSYFILSKESVTHIESALNVSKNTSTIFKIDNIANIQSLVLDNKIPFERVFDIRYNKNIKHYRKWINSISENTNAEDITREYLDEVQGKNNFFGSALGKFVRTVGMFGIGSGIGAAVSGVEGAAIGGTIGKATDFGLALFDSYILDGILKGWNPRMFVEEIKYEAEPPEGLKN